jgi:hypothetical protein
VPLHALQRLRIAHVHPDLVGPRERSAHQKGRDATPQLTRELAVRVRRQILLGLLGRYPNHVDAAA